METTHVHSHNNAKRSPTDPVDDPSSQKRARTAYTDRTRLSHTAYSVGWICALPIESTAAQAMLDDTHPDLPVDPNDSNTYILGNIGAHNVVIACLPFDHYGTTNAAVVANNMHRTFPSLQIRLMVGVGGGVPGKVDIRLGDVVVGSQVVQYDFGKTTGEGQFHRTSIPIRPPQPVMTAVATLRSRHDLESSRMPSILSEVFQRHPSIGQYSYPYGSPDRLFSSAYKHVNDLFGCECCDPAKVLNRAPRNNISPEIHYGVIASGNRVIKHGETRDKWAALENVLCFEMEAAGLMDHFPCLVIRGVCDYADSHKNKEWQKYAAVTAAAYAKEFLTSVVPKQLQETYIESAAIVEHDSVSNSQCPPLLTQDQRQALLDTLRFDQIDNRRVTIKNAHAKTCKWFLNKTEYLEWMDASKLGQHRGLLWIKGKPGTGKSTLMKFTFSRATKSMKNAVIISFFFNARGHDLEKSTIGMYRSLLWQLLDQLPELQHVVESLRLTSQDAGQQHWPIESVKDVFKQAIQNAGSSKRPITCFIDALDECPEDQVRDMVSFFANIGDEAISMGVRFSICFSSRHYPHITIDRGIELVLEGQEGHGQDIANYIETELKIGKGKLAEKIRAEVQQKASGIFMWAVLVTGILNKEYDRGRMHMLRKRLQEIPGDLHELFRDILTRDHHGKDELLLCIQWVLFAREPLSPHQLYFAIFSGITDDIPSSDDIEKEDIERFILDSSKGLTEITKSKLATVQFIHESVRDFLLKENAIGNIWPELKSNVMGISHERLKLCCHAYMQIDISAIMNSDEKRAKAPTSITKQDREHVALSFPFLEYAVRNVLFHTDTSSSRGILQDKFISCFEIPKWIELHNIFEQHEVRRYRSDTRLSYILAEVNAPSLIKAHTTTLSCIEEGKERYGCPLLAAIAHDNSEALEAFREVLVMALPLETRIQVQAKPEFQFPSPVKKPGLNFRFSAQRSMASHLAEYGDGRLLTLVLQHRKLELDVQDKKGGRTPLSWAAQCGHQSIAGILLENDEVDTNSRDEFGMTPFAHACESEHQGMIKMFLENSRTDFESRDSIGRTQFFSAVINHRQGVLDLLLKTGEFDPDSRDNNGRTPLSWATINNTVEAMKLLLKTGKVDPDSRDNDSRTPLSWAATYNTVEAMKLLLETGKVDPDSRDKDGQTPLSWAASNDAVEAMKLLLETGKVDPNSQDNNGQTPLSWAAIYGHQAALDLLLKTGKVNANSWDNHS